MARKYELKRRDGTVFPGPEVEDLLYAVDEKTIYPDATQSEHGLLSTVDKKVIDEMSDMEAMDALDIINACPLD